jgi:hypothetical protein
MKLFGNGGIQMTGVPSQEFATDSVSWLLELIKRLPQSPFAITNTTATVATGTPVTAGTAGTAGAAGAAGAGTPAANTVVVPAVTKISVPLINTDYSLSHDIQQDNLHRIFIEEYNLFSMLEKTIYQGVNTKYFYNTTNNKTGVCRCAAFCKGQGNGSGNGECKRITMSIFRTGKIIITGARQMAQIHEAYEFLNRIFEKHATEVLIKRV